MLNFADVIKLLKQGKKLRRLGWNGKNQYIYYVPSADYVAVTNVAKEIMDENGKVKYNAYVALRTEDGTISIWNPTTTDCMSEDWIMVD